MSEKKSESTIPLRITVLGLPTGEIFRVQHKHGLLDASETLTDSMSFDFSVRVQSKPDGLNFLGDFVNGPTGDRFVYVNSGTLAGDVKSSYTRRAKVKLAGISKAQITQVIETPGKKICATISGVSKDGGPACASVPLLKGGWSVV